MPPYNSREQETRLDIAAVAVGAVVAAAVISVVVLNAAAVGAGVFIGLALVATFVWKK